MLAKILVQIDTKQKWKRIYALYKNGAEQIKALKLLSKHKIKGTETEEHFEISEESEGTQRLIDIIPALMTLQSFETIIVIDEIDRRLHPHITKKFLEIFLGVKKQSQLIVTHIQRNDMLCAFL
jgi:AAA15 family ATPase/GTPase